MGYLIPTPMRAKGMNMPTGTVKWFDAQKGDGVIAPDTGGGDILRT